MMVLAKSCSSVVGVTVAGAWRQGAEMVRGAHRNASRQTSCRLGKMLSI